MTNKLTVTTKQGLGFNQLSSTKTLVKVSILSVIAFLIMFFIEIPVFFFPGFLKIDLSDIPALIGAFAMGPAAGIMIELVKNILHFITKSQTGGVGEFANFLVGIGMVLPAAIIYGRDKSKKGAILGMAVGTVGMAVVGGLANYFILLPFYAKMMPMEAIIEMSAAANKAIVDMKTLILYAVVPFNLLKGIVVAIMTGLFYKKLSPILKIK